jgi:hypothetical protein
MELDVLWCYNQLHMPKARVYSTKKKTPSRTHPSMWLADVNAGSFYAKSETQILYKHRVLPNGSEAV